MPDVALSAVLREENGTRPAKRLRAEGRIPAVLYGHGAEPIALSVDARDYRTASMSQAGGGVLLDLRLGDEEHLVITREIQRHPVRRTITHIDFQTVGRDEVVPADIPVHLIGEALSVSRGDGTVDQALFTLHVRAKPADIPGAIEVDITDLEIGSTIRVSDLTLPAGVQLDIDPETAVVIGQSSHAEVAPEGVEAAAEAPEGGAEAASAEAPAEAESEASEGS